LPRKGLAAIFELDGVPLQDRPDISYAVAPDRWKPLPELSTGQKGTVIISLALVDGTGPLVVDHPEEPLDTKSVYSHVVNALRDTKERRQFIFTTHNPNIAVGADADLSHILGATADKGTIESRGSTDHKETNKRLLLHLEGGPEALQRRIQKYYPAIPS
jgi:ABC-type cobalamin/Fe3+-siderophores transport system ATPase subunit